VTPAEPRWVPRLAIEAIHFDQVREHGGLIGLRDEAALESALARAPHRWTYEPESDLVRLAVDYVFGICTRPPFHDGNKRTSFLAGVVFLGLNGHDLAATDKAVVETMMAVASGELCERAIADWIRPRIVPRRGI
jgi:death-on-curing protein